MKGNPLDRIEDGIRLVVTRGPCSWNGYLGVPSDHPLAGHLYDDLPLDCHGGLTFADEGNGKTFPKGWFWYGFDYAHLGDDNHTVEDVIKEVERVAWDFRKLARLAEKIANRVVA